MFAASPVWAIVFSLIIVGWAAIQFRIRMLDTLRYDEYLASSGRVMKELTTDHDKRALAVIDAAVRFNPFSFIVSTYDTAEDAARRLAAVENGRWRLLHWRRYHPTFMLCHCPSTHEMLLAFRGTETSEDDRANRNVLGVVHRLQPPFSGVRVCVHRGLRDRLQTYWSDAFAAPEFRTALRAVNAAAATPKKNPVRSIIVGYSLGGSVAAALTVLLRDERLAPAFGLSVADVADLRRDVGASPRDLHCVAYAAFPAMRILFDADVDQSSPTVPSDRAAAAADGGGGGADAPPPDGIIPDMRNISTVLKEGDIVPVLSLANISGALGFPWMPSRQNLLSVGDVLMVRDEEWLGHDSRWIAENREPRSPLLYYFIAYGNVDLHRRLLGHVALLRSFRPAFQGREMTRPLHSHGRWRETVDAMALEATVVGHPLPATPAAILS